MNCDLAHSLIDGGVRVDDSPELAEHLRVCAECLSEYEAESVLTGAVLYDRIRPSRKLEHALLAIPTRERRLHVLAPAMVPLAGVACGIGALVVAIALRGEGSHLVRQGPLATPSVVTGPDDRATGAAPTLQGAASGSATPRPAGADLRAASPGPATATTGAPAPTLLALGPRVIEPGNVPARPPAVRATEISPPGTQAPATPVPTLPPEDGGIAPVPGGTPTPPGFAPSTPIPTPTSWERTPPTRAPGPPQPSPSAEPSLPTPTRAADLPPTTPTPAATSGPMPTASVAPSASPTATSTPSPTRTPSPTPTPL